MKPINNWQAIATGNAMRKQRWRISGKPSFRLAAVANELINSGMRSAKERGSRLYGSRVPLTMCVLPAFRLNMAPLIVPLCELYYEFHMHNIITLCMLYVCHS